MEVLRDPAQSCKPTPAPVTKTKLAPKKQAKKPKVIDFGF
jgi:hypothetical protein